MNAKSVVMDEKDFIESARKQLDLVLGFFPRVDSKASVVLAADTGMLGFLAAQVPVASSLNWWEIAVPIGTAVLLGISYWFLYKGAFPGLKGGTARSGLENLRDIKGEVRSSENHFYFSRVGHTALGHVTSGLRTHARSIKASRNTGSALAWQSKTT